MKYLTVFFIGALSFNVNAQNLIPDPSFEGYVYDFCGLQTYSDFNTLVDDWKTPTHGSPDVYFSVINDTCYNYMPNTTYSGPLGIKGKQTPRNGRAFVGFYAYTIPGLNQREYIQSELLSPMTIGQEYVVKFYLSLADFIEYGTANIGAYLSTSAVNSANDGVLSYTPQVTFATAVMDTGNWVLVADTIQAQDSYSYITVGNFNDDNSTALVNNPGFVSAPGVYGVYYYIEDISVEPVTINSIDDPFSITFNVFPTLASESIIAQSNRNGEYMITTIHGAIVKSGVIREGDNHIDISNVTNGTYIITVLSEGLKSSKRIVKSN